jgi:penicillin-binding protein 1A
VSSLPPSPGRPRGARLLARLALGFLTAACVGLLCAAIAATFLYRRQPDLTELTDYRPKQPLRVYTRDGIEIGQFGAERRYLLPISQIPRQLQDAVLAVEDKRFREHFGVDARGVVRAVLTNLWQSRRSQGGSTITQQVARTFYLSSRKTYIRKLSEMLLAVKIERQLSKDQVLELYMNQIFLGHRAYGFEAASQTYFGKTLTALSLAEHAMLAGLPQNPIHANPITNFARARQRQLQVLERMRTAGLITDAAAAQAREEPLHIRSGRDVGLHAEHAAEMVRQIVFERYGDSAYTLGLQVTTTLQSGDQHAARRALRRGLLAYDARQPYRGPEDHEDLGDDVTPSEAAELLAEHADDDDLRVAIVTAASPQRVQAALATGEVVEVHGEGLRQAQASLSPRAQGGSAIRRGAIIRLLRTPGAEGAWSIRQWPEVEGALVANEPATGRVRALVGGFDFGRNQFNHAANAWRQPGSSFKPFLVSAALEQRVMPATLLNDAPLSLPGGTGAPDWDPQNADGRFDGPLTLREALARSRNIATIRLVQMIGPAAAREWTTRFGFDPAQHPADLTLALGAGQTTPLQLAGAYGVLANGGHRVPARLIERIVDARGNVLFEAGPVELDESERAIPARNAFVTNSVLNEVMRTGTGARAQTVLKRQDLYGKTGTTNDAVDAWFAGFHPSLAAVVWIGHDRPRSLGARESGGALSLPVWIEFMAHALQGVPVDTPRAPDDVIAKDGDWVYIEWAFGGAHARVGFDEPAAPPGVPAAPSMPSPATSAPPADTVPAAPPAGPMAFD